MKFSSLWKSEHWYISNVCLQANNINNTMNNWHQLWKPGTLKGKMINTWYALQFSYVLLKSNLQWILGVSCALPYLTLEWNQRYLVLWTSAKTQEINRLPLSLTSLLYAGGDICEAVNIVRICKSKYRLNYLYIHIILSQIIPLLCLAWWKIDINCGTSLSSNFSIAINQAQH